MGVDGEGIRREGILDCARVTLIIYLHLTLEPISLLLVLKYIFN